jgi:hypothetical protein
MNFKGFLAAAALIVLSATANAQSGPTVAVNGLGSSALFLELGLAASSPTSGGGLGASCVWSESTSSVVATDTTVGSLTDTGNAFVAWTPGAGGCALPDSTSQIYAYLQTDSVVGNRCLFNAQLSTGAKCTIAYPTNDPATASTPLILASGEVSLPTAIATALNSAAVNVAGTDIRPEDAEFAYQRVVAPCGEAINSSQYWGLGYTNGGTIASSISGSPFNVISFSLPSSFTVTPVGATPIVVAANGFPAGSISSAALAKFLDGTYSYTGQAASTPTATGNPVTVFIREPLSGTYNTMEYNVPNTTVLQTSQDAGINQPSTQVNCNGTSVNENPLNMSTPSGGARKRAIGTGQELSEALTTSDSLGYGFWSVANFKGAVSSSAVYLEVDGVDPLQSSGTAYTGTIPTTGTTALANVTLANVANGSYPIWSLLRLVNVGSTASVAVSNLATAAQQFVPSGTDTSRPDFIAAPSLTVVRSHFLPPAGVGEPTAAANGHVGLPTSACTTPEAGGDVGGEVFTLAADSTFCGSRGGSPAGETGHRR